MSLDLQDFQRLVIRVKLDKAVSYSSLFNKSSLNYWSNFLQLDLSRNRIISSFFIPEKNNFSFYINNKSTQSFDLNITYSNLKIQQSFIENILLETNEFFFSSFNISIENLFVHRIPSLQKISSLDNTYVSFYFTNPTFILSYDGANKRYALPTLSSIIESLETRLNEFHSESVLSSIITQIDLSSLDYSISSYNLKSLNIDELGVGCLGQVTFFFTHIPKELHYLFYLVNVFGLGAYFERGLGWVNVKTKGE
ncbi:MAG: CRISPR system precrRNA processing endoribonuclease RAMP protein Cas6 [Candidatus Heimdallarchaeum endolithica]|uniref:CRISPR system precrRNA processing endoribonuclease RAMP protein Cas6 n=1 Tax=Candidatus Heimdallarchaeum endolithica TaxID=2876572 RepID=A0A9Y1BSZ5_9ARCH|nr:MAG: CRISPR system precrRNA processing endoribonuclease RAMP protein Cas6 [Candidatus Heimdallarchaeum endolithica]